ncbi:hypothetical protein Mgra_00006114 [Meloidogyne graminicola]|uniref:Uncharacterized protein n=1 Tax=Meloidogyne graminicola TaxID=189291 RepID=A0A8S9ZMD1_9BILA|nr:hypothetical protein Mgra_00006114 [Meloidogyne graminicola]
MKNLNILAFCLILLALICESATKQRKKYRNEEEKPHGAVEILSKVEEFQEKKFDKNTEENKKEENLNENENKNHKHRKHNINNNEILLNRKKKGAAIVPVLISSVAASSALIAMSAVLLIYYLKTKSSKIRKFNNKLIMRIKAKILSHPLKNNFYLFNSGFNEYA